MFSPITCARHADTCSLFNYIYMCAFFGDLSNKLRGISCIAKIHGFQSICTWSKKTPKS